MADTHIWLHNLQARKEQNLNHRHNTSRYAIPVSTKWYKDFHESIRIYIKRKNLICILPTIECECHKGIKEKNVRINYDTIIPRVDFDYEAKAVVTDDFSEDVVIHDDDTFEPVDSAAFVTSVMDNLLSSVFFDGGSEGRRRRRSYDVGSGVESVGEVIEEESET